MKRFGSLLLLGMVTVMVAAGAAYANEPAKVGELELLSLSTPHPYSTGVDAGAPAWVIYYPGATYIRVHFSRFQLADGDFLEVSNSDGSESHTYEGKGPHDTGEFWAFAIAGDTAVLRFQASFGGGYGFEIDSYGRGTAPVLPPPPAQPESVCGTQDWKDVKCYESSYPTEFERARGAVLALIGCCSACTAFKVSDSGQFMTNNHCTSTNAGVQSTELRFEYQNPLCSGGTPGYTGAVMGSQLVRTDATLDYTLFTTTGSSSSIPCLMLDNRLAPVGERIYIAGHPAGDVKKLSIESDRNAGGLCAVDASPYKGNGADTDVGYYCDTTNGSSGSPVLSGTTHNVVAIHHFGGCLNSGVRMDRILAQISNQLDTCSGGGGGNCGNGTIDPGEQCDGSNLDGQTCQSLGFGGGTLSCSNCAFNTSLCCKSVNQACASNSQCCSGKCSGKAGRKTCR